MGQTSWLGIFIFLHQQKHLFSNKHHPLLEGKTIFSDLIRPAPDVQLFLRKLLYSCEHIGLFQPMWALQPQVKSNQGVFLLLKKMYPWHCHFQNWYVSQQYLPAERNGMKICPSEDAVPTGLTHFCGTSSTPLACPKKKNTHCHPSGHCAHIVPHTQQKQISRFQTPK